MTETTQSDRCREVAQRALAAMIAAGLSPIDALREGGPLFVSDLMSIAAQVGCSAADFLA